MTTYPMTTSVCFAIEGTERTVTVHDVPFNWKPDAFGDRDGQAADAALRALPAAVRLEDVTLVPIWIETSPQKGT